MPYQTLRLSAAALLAALAFASPALADECPAGQTATNALTGAPTMPKGVIDTVIGSVDLGPEINVPDRQLRTRRLVIEPGGIVPLHSHADRPALIYTMSGTVTEYRSSCAVPIVHRAGEVTREAEGISHYWINTGTETAILLSSDVHHGK
jgi:quercetin dioxygenase-like cupin family protein